MTYEIIAETKVVEDGKIVLDAERAKLLHLIQRDGSMAEAAQVLGIHVDDASSMIESVADAMGKDVICREGSRMVLTDDARELLELFELKRHMVDSQMENLWKKSWLTADGIVILEGKVVLIRRGREPFKGMMALPGGIVEYGERVEDCVVREIEEETGLRTRVLDLVGCYSSPDRDPRGHFVTITFNLQVIGGTLRGGDDAAEAVLCPLDALPEMASDHGRILADCLRKLGRDTQSISTPKP